MFLDLYYSSSRTDDVDSADVVADVDVLVADLVFDFDFVDDFELELLPFLLLAICFERASIRTLFSSSPFAVRSLMRRTGSSKDASLA